MNKALLHFYQLKDKKPKEIVELGVKETLNVINIIQINFKL